MSDQQFPSDPMERIIAQALVAGGFSFVTDLGGKNSTRLDFALPNGVQIEVKRMHSPRIADQMARAPDVIAVQGEGAVRFFASLLIRSAQ